MRFVDTLPSMKRSKASRPLLPTTRSPSCCGAWVKITGATAPCSFRTVPLSFSAANCFLVSVIILAARTSMRSISSWIYPPLPATTGCDRNGARSALISTTCSTVTCGGSTNGSLATQFSAHRPYSDPSVATSTFMRHLLLFEFPSRLNRHAHRGLAGRRIVGGGRSNRKAGGLENTGTHPRKINQSPDGWRYDIDHDGLCRLRA